MIDMIKIKAELERLQVRIYTTKFGKWLLSNRSLVCISRFTPSKKSLQSGLPTVTFYRGLRYIVEVKNQANDIEWHFYWDSDRIADLYEESVADHLASPPAVRTVVRNVSAKRSPWYQRWAPWGIISGGIAGLAALASNADKLSSAYHDWTHHPVVTLEAALQEPLRIRSHQNNEKVHVQFRGDPFYRARMTKLSMEVKPVNLPSIPRTQWPVPQNTPLGPTRSFGVSEQFTVPLLLSGYRRGTYEITLTGVVRTVRAKAPFKTAQPLLLEVRDDVEIKIKRENVAPWPDPGRKSKEAIVTFAMQFGKIEPQAIDIRVKIDGHWIGFKFHELPGQFMIERQSHMRHNPEGRPIYFVIQNVESREFSGTPGIHLIVQSDQYLTRDQWQEKINENVCRVQHQNSTP
ncbi:MAG: hypothetical protein P1V20_28670 [Verrucomicrobiales bacterium]|nr:hypothetical protein [Verrucomicrobiales bacterium]